MLHFLMKQSYRVIVVTQKTIAKAYGLLGFILGHDCPIPAPVHDRKPVIRQNNNVQEDCQNQQTCILTRMAFK